jgi:hypothetical protein
MSNLGYNGINAIQSEGTLYNGTCDACDTWCYEWGGTHAAFCGPWSIYSTFGSCGTYINSAVGGGGLRQAYIQLPLNPAKTYTGVAVARSVGGAEADLIRFYSGAVGSTVLVDSSGLSWSGSVTGASTLLISATNASDFQILSVSLHGNGPNPYGTDNCT